MVQVLALKLELPQILLSPQTSSRVKNPFLLVKWQRLSFYEHVSLDQSTTC